MLFLNAFSDKQFTFVRDVIFSGVQMNDGEVSCDARGDDRAQDLVNVAAKCIFTDHKAAA